MKKLSILTLCLLLLFTAGCAPAKVPAKDPEIKEQTITISLWYPDENALELHEEKRTITVKEGESAEWAAIVAFYGGPETVGLVNLIDGSDGDVLSVKTENGICTVDLSRNFELVNTGGTTKEGFILSGIVNTLCSLEGIDAVKFNLEGDTAAEYGGHFILDEPFYPAK